MAGKIGMQLGGDKAIWHKGEGENDSLDVRRRGVHNDGADVRST